MATAAESLAETLARADVERVHGVVGESLNEPSGDRRTSPGRQGGTVVRISSRIAWLLSPLSAVSICLTPAAAQSLASAASPGTAAAESTVVAPGPQYAKRGVWTTFAGRHYRNLWVTPIRVPVLDLEHFAGGLRPLEAHTGSQTKSLRFAGADGRQYQFRSVDKDPTATLAPELRGTAYSRALRDGVSHSFPGAPLIANGLLETAGVLTQPQFLALMPDDPALGDFRSDFKGVMGLIEQRTEASEDDERVAGGVRQVVSPTGLFRRVDAVPKDLVDTRAFLRARLMDIFIGDRDRHRDQFRWAAFGDGRPTIWEPISRDHDEAFVNLDGLALRITAMYYPPLVTFGPPTRRTTGSTGTPARSTGDSSCRWSERHGTRSRPRFRAGSPTRPSTRPCAACLRRCTPSAASASRVCCVLGATGSRARRSGTTTFSRARSRSGPPTPPRWRRSPGPTPTTSMSSSARR